MRKIEASYEAQGETFKTEEEALAFEKMHEAETEASNALKKFQETFLETFKTADGKLLKLRSGGWFNTYYIVRDRLSFFVDMEEVDLALHSIKSFYIEDADTLHISFQKYVGGQNPYWDISFTNKELYSSKEAAFAKLNKIRQEHIEMLQEQIEKSND